jgi:hypothetical protein
MIKKTFTYLFMLTLLISKVNAQNSKPANWCGTTLSKAQLDWLDEYKRNDAAAKYRSKSGSNVAYVPIKAHIVGKDDGSGYYDIQKLFDDINDANMRYDKDSVGIHFFLYEDIDYINNTSFYNDGSQSNPMANSIMASAAHKRPGALNMFFVSASPGLCGYFSPGLDVVVIIGACGGKNATTVAHEVGHYFSLPHTFHGWEGVWSGGCDTIVKNGMSKPSNPEKVDGSNCAIAGDKFCDTRADYVPDRWPCPWNCLLRKDPNGVVINPDPTLYMSYADDACVNRFSKEQVAAIQANYNTVRSGYLLNSPQNFAHVSGKSTITSPLPGEDHPIDFIPIHWTSLPGANKYVVALYRTTNLVNQVWSRVTTDTFTAVLAADGLVPNLNYTVKVMGFNVGYPGNLWSDKLDFTTSDATGINTISNEGSFKIYPNPVNNYFIVNYVSSTNSNFVMTVNDISGREILSKIISSNNNSEVVETNTWAAGEYFVQLKDANNKIIKTEKVIVAK